MKKIDYRIKFLLVALVIAIVFAGGFAWKIDKINEEFEAMRSDYSITLDELDATKNTLMSAQKDYRTEVEKSTELSEELNNMNEKLEEANTTISDLKSEEYKLVYIGDFKITYYCDGRYPHICGGNGVTASGKPTEVGVTAAADWSVLPKGSIIYIEGIGFREVQDVGGAVNNNHIDVLVQNHSEAISSGVDHEGVWLLVRKQGDIGG